MRCHHYPPSHHHVGNIAASPSKFHREEALSARDTDLDPSTMQLSGENLYSSATVNRPASVSLQVYLYVPSTFAGGAAYFLGELNAAHPFREGNGGTQREFLRALGLKAGYYIDWRAATAEK